MSNKYYNPWDRSQGFSNNEEGRLLTNINIVLQAQKLMFSFFYILVSRFFNELICFLSLYYNNFGDFLLTLGI